MTRELTLSLHDIRRALSVALLCDALDAAGRTCQSPRIPLRPLTVKDGLLAGRAKTTLWADMAHEDPQPYQLELAAVDSCRPDDVLICAASGSDRSGIWGELLSTAARRAGCVGVIADGSVRDLAKMQSMRFPVFARATSPYDSRNRQRVIDYDVPVELGGVTVRPGDLVAADLDGIVIVPQDVEATVVRAAWEKAHAENLVRDAIAQGMSATEAFETWGVL